MQTKKRGEDHSTVPEYCIAPVLYGSSTVSRPRQKYRLLLVYPSTVTSASLVRGSPPGTTVFHTLLDGYKYQVREILFGLLTYKGIPYRISTRCRSTT